MIFIDKEHHKCQIIDFAIPYDTRLDNKEVEKIEKYLDLARKPKKVWNMKVDDYVSILYSFFSKTFIQ